MIQFQEITKVYVPLKSQPVIALEGVSFSVEKNEFISIVGRSGAGKSTLLKLILAQEKPTKGTVFFENVDIHKLNSETLAGLRRKIGVIFQDYKLIASKTVFENLSYIMEIINMSNMEIKRDVPEVLGIVGLRDKANNFPDELSGGEQQRIAIARALIHRPDIILADEPTGNLDPYSTADIIKLLLKIQEMGTTVVLSTHNKDIINRLGKRVITLEDGKVVMDEQKGKFIF